MYRLQNWRALHARGTKKEREGGGKKSKVIEREKEREKTVTNKVIKKERRGERKKLIKKGEGNEVMRENH